MSTNRKLLFEEISGSIIDAAFEVYNSLGCGLLEKVYENSLKRLGFVMNFAKTKLEYERFIN